MRTVETVVSAKAHIWAVPKPEYLLRQELEEADGDTSKITPFQFEITNSSSHWRDAAVHVHEFDCAGVVPAGIDLVMKAVQTLRDKILAVQERADKEIVKLEEQIKNLALIEYKPATPVIPGERDYDDCPF